MNLTLEGETFTRNVNHLVAKAFIPSAPRPDFISLIHRDGDKENCFAQNLMWRPRHFAVSFHQQFRKDRWLNSHSPIVDLKTGITYPDIQTACVEFGLLFSDVILAIFEQTYVWPTYQQFRLLAD